MGRLVVAESMFFFLNFFVYFLGWIYLNSLCIFRFVDALKDYALALGR